MLKGCSSESSRVKRITFGDAKMGMHKDTANQEKNHIALEVGGIKSDRCSANLLGLEETGIVRNG